VALNRPAATARAPTPPSTSPRSTHSASTALPRDRPRAT
jgi:hypothetical protein